MITEMDLQRIQQALEYEREKLLYGFLDQKAIEHDEENLDDSDLAILYESQELRSSLDEISGKKLNRILEALDRISKGTYGICLECKSTIPAERLIALPYAELCVPCQERLEGKGRRAWKSYRYPGIE